MQLSNSDATPVPLAMLKSEFVRQYGVHFQSNYSQMKNFGPKNHAKVFAESPERMVSLWPPIASFVKRHFTYSQQAYAK